MKSLGEGRHSSSQAGGWSRTAGAVSPDHIHILVVAPPQLAPAKLVQFIKGRSSRLLQQEFPALRKKYWDHRFTDDRDHWHRRGDERASAAAPQFGYVPSSNSLL